MISKIETLIASIKTTAHTLYPPNSNPTDRAYFLVGSFESNLRSLSMMIENLENQVASLEAELNEIKKELL